MNKNDLADIETQEDINRLVNCFYSEVRTNAVLGPIFNQIIGSNWDRHLSVMYKFWGSIAFGNHMYSGNPMQKHLALNRIVPIQEKEFNEWLFLFYSITDKLYAGPIADLIKTRAKEIAKVMQIKIKNQF